MALTQHISQVDKQQTPYKIDPDQTLRASQALLKHVQAEVKRLKDADPKKNLLATNDSDDEQDSEDAQPIWLTLATKQYITDKSRLKPSKIAVPHSLHTNENSTICIITADPQRATKNVVADPTFPKDLSTRITKIIGFTKLLSRYKSFEQRRQLLSEHDIFLADDRIVSRLPKALGKVFYKGTAKRPIPVNLASREKTEKVKKVVNAAPSKEEKDSAVASSAIVAKEIQRALRCVPVSLSPGYNIAVRVGLESFTADQLKENIVTAANGIIEKHVVSGWKNVKSIHVKTPTSLALPIWLAEDLFVEAEPKAVETGEDQADGVDKKRKRNPNTSKGPQSGERKKAKLAEAKLREKADGDLRKASLAAQKAAVLEVA